MDTPTDQRTTPLNQALIAHLGLNPDHVEFAGIGVYASERGQEVLLRWTSSATISKAELERMSERGRTLSPDISDPPNAD